MRRERESARRECAKSWLSGEWQNEGNWQRRRQRQTIKYNAELSDNSEKRQLCVISIFKYNMARKETKTRRRQRLVHCTLSLPLSLANCAIIIDCRLCALVTVKSNCYSWYIMLMMLQLYVMYIATTCGKLCSRCMQQLQQQQHAKSRLGLCFLYWFLLSSFLVADFPAATATAAAAHAAHH